MLDFLKLILINIFINFSEEDSLGSYFSDCWFQKPEMWCSIYRNDLFIKGNNTTNRLERYHSTIKAALNHMQARLPQLLQALIDLVTLRDLGRDIKEVESKIKFLKTKPPALLQTLSQHVTEFALKLVTWRFCRSQTSSPSLKYTNIKLFCIFGTFIQFTK